MRLREFKSAMLRRDFQGVRIAFSVKTNLRTILSLQRPYQSNVLSLTADHLECSDQAKRERIRILVADVHVHGDGPKLSSWMRAAAKHQTCYLGMQPKQACHTKLTVKQPRQRGKRLATSNKTSMLWGKHWYCEQPLKLRNSAPFNHTEYQPVTCAGEAVKRHGNSPQA